MPLRKKDKSCLKATDKAFLGFSVSQSTTSSAQKALEKKIIQDYTKVLEVKYPFAKTSAEQAKVVARLTKDRGSMKAGTPEYDAFSQYLLDAIDYRNEIAKSEKDAAVKKEKEQAEAQAASIQSEALLGEQSQKSATTKKILLFGGLGLAAVVLMFVLLKKKKQ